MTRPLAEWGCEVLAVDPGRRTRQPWPRGSANLTAEMLFQVVVLGLSRVPISHHGKPFRGLRDAQDVNSAAQRRGVLSGSSGSALGPLPVREQLALLDGVDVAGGRGWVSQKGNGRRRLDPFLHAFVLHVGSFTHGRVRLVRSQTRWRRCATCWPRAFLGSSIAPCAALPRRVRTPRRVSAVREGSCLHPRRMCGSARRDDDGVEA